MKVQISKQAAYEGCLLGARVDDPLDLLVAEIPEKNFKLLEDLDLWIVEGLRDQPHEAHAHFDLTFEWIKRVKPKKSILTHLAHVDYDHVLSICPENVFPGIDGMVFHL